MAKRPMRFIHAADLHLERPPHGLDEAPDHLRARLIDAPFTAAERIFDAAVSESVDFVILAGDVMHVELAGPRGVVFLIEQFERLAKHGIDVYWCGGQVDAHEHWPRSIRLPDNVHVFGTAEVPYFEARRGDETIARLSAWSRATAKKHRASDLDADTSEVFTIAVAHGRFERPMLVDADIDYWALGGAHARDTLVSSPSVAHYPGTPQGRSHDENGPHGATLVRVDAQGEAHLSFVAANSLQWHDERIAVERIATREALHRALAERTSELLAAAQGADLLVRWTLSGNGPLTGSVGRRSLAAEVQSQLRRDYGHRPHTAWATAVEVEAPTALHDDLYEQDSILGGFLRSVRQHQANGAPVADLRIEEYLGSFHAGGALAEAVRLDDDETRMRVLRKAAILGADLLAGEESHS